MKKLNLFRKISVICALIFVTLLAACGGDRADKAIIGTWVSEGNDIVTFNKDGSCTAPFTYDGAWLESANQYTIKDDDTLVLSSRDGHAGGSYERVETQEEALDDRWTYYLSGNTLVIDKEYYSKSK